VGGHVELVEAVIFRLEIRRHAALAGDAAAERYADELAGEIVGPLVIGADEFLGGAAELAAELGGAVPAAILDHVDRAVLGPRHHDRRRAHIRADEIAGVRHLGFERHVIPRAAVEDLFHFALVNVLVGVDPIGDDGEIVAGPHVLPGCDRSAVGGHVAILRFAVAGAR
jgi:hypothetical protein